MNLELVGDPKLIGLASWARFEGSRNYSRIHVKSKDIGAFRPVPSKVKPVRKSQVPLDGSSLERWRVPNQPVGSFLQKLKKRRVGRHAHGGPTTCQNAREIDAHDTGVHDVRAPCLGLLYTYFDLAKKCKICENNFKNL